MNTLQAHVWDKGLKISKYILMKAYESKMRALYKGQGSWEEREWFCNWAFIKTDLKTF